MGSLRSMATSQMMPMATNIVLNMLRQHTHRHQTRHRRHRTSRDRPAPDPWSVPHARTCRACPCPPARRCASCRWPCPTRHTRLGRTGARQQSRGTPHALVLFLVDVPHFLTATADRVRSSTIFYIEDAAKLPHVQFLPKIRLESHKLHQIEGWVLTVPAFEAVGVLAVERSRASWSAASAPASLWRAASTRSFWAPQPPVAELLPVPPCGRASPGNSSSARTCSYAPAADCSSLGCTQLCTTLHCNATLS